MQTVLNVVSHSETETVGLAEKLVPFLRPGDLIVLTGELGAGKTVFVRGLARGLGVDPALVNSPSFTIVNEYPEGRLPLYHFDLYRIGNPAELLEVGWNDYLAREGITVVEWGERAGDCLPPRYYRAVFRVEGEHNRRIDIGVVGDDRP
ncbi:MAG TPA: tRNA (adenosine(37)-N6)-threonylcarbamoyltransferase complex ATPase subunit type 1 TsaE [candidate division Zixibacteria bacterium]|nr:tRNA (adenosine(37)-N6)-threonylcarbamoyltransferase complex ATPase subunit type 1 TsaE [candidate division Zixibacteria bacterium]MDD4916473.1 tRNA (adenosine(37)-N6)-threonylcarbamoyltransferase complex ATPase subunit type 1 TsaE [candidate division Zixibacteria bacterium]MDM7971870.1 tRNA (adenosine(37)-N6)-threonylcarbamoyltransferase complex ATPase subunit type 1 TsaE [candidate division Zixibacteria bacterium]HOD65102.1 tRNA (adenosine(37)-N6)-threonylcarbamoyltransferase complex ATPase